MSSFSTPNAIKSAALGAKREKAVLITGASTGIGRKITEHLASAGYFIYAGARKESDLQALGTIQNVQAVRLDVTKLDEIAAAVDTVNKGGRGLYGLINNAGVVTGGAVVDVTDEEFDVVMDVNVYGPQRVTKAFAPLLIAQKGRIITIGSIAGIVALKSFSTYAMSKHAMEAFTDSLAEEMAPFGVLVSIIEPGGFNSECFNTAAKRGGLDAELTEMVNSSKRDEPDEVAATVKLALLEPRPKRRYVVAPDESEAELAIKKQIEQLVQLNEGHKYTFERETLLKMLDTELSNARPRVG